MYGDRNQRRLSDFVDADGVERNSLGTTGAVNGLAAFRKRGQESRHAFTFETDSGFEYRSARQQSILR